MCAKSSKAFWWRNKLDRLLMSVFYSLVLHLQVSLEPHAGVEHLFLALPKLDNRLGRKCMTGTNALAYIAMV